LSPSRTLSEIKLKRTDTTLDLSQKAKRAKEKREGKLYKIWEPEEVYILVKEWGEAVESGTNISCLLPAGKLLTADVSEVGTLGTYYRTNLRAKAAGTLLIPRYLPLSSHSCYFQPWSLIGQSLPTIGSTSDNGQPHCPRKAITTFCWHCKACLMQVGKETSSQ
jgi:hypothetical protein